MLTKEQIRVDEIIDNARIAFSRFGYKKTSVEDIAKLSGLTKTALYYYFKNKEEVFKAVVLKEAEILRGKIIDAVVNAETPVNQLKVFIESRMLGLQDVSIIYDIFKSELYDHLNFINELRSSFQSEEHELLKSILANGQEQGYFKPMDIECTSETIGMVLKGLEIPLFIDLNLEKQRRKLEQVIDLLLRGIIIIN
ncbi:MAG: TetR/AcrR family transcriptional regulator [Bacteroidales bacterium]|nr:TetR/AcrR family transcriptional regulator [Bacteroidales bacterium]